MKKISVRSGVFFLVLSLCTFTQTGLCSTIHHVPFLCQAPDGKWVQPFADGCEEAAIIMAERWLNYHEQDRGAARLPAGQAMRRLYSRSEGKKEILDMVSFQKKTLGGHYDLTAEQSLQLMRDYYGYSSGEVITLSSYQDIISELDKGNILILPAAGRLLKNPYFTPPGPLYHYLVVTGYDPVKKQFITNDPGTRRGYNFRYPYQRLFLAVHDWAGSKKNILTGEKRAIVISQKAKVKGQK